MSEKKEEQSPSPSRFFGGGSVAERLESVPHAKAIGLQYVDDGENWGLLKVPYQKKLVGNPDTGVIHGGVITALLDHCSGFAVGRTLWQNPRSMATLDLRIDYMNPAEPDKDIFGRAECYRVTNNVAFVRATAYVDTIDDPIAASSAAFMLGTPVTREMLKGL